jgi:hypothetical protein
LAKGGFSNVDWVGDLQDKKSAIGYVFRLGSSPITWGSRKQPCIVLSSIEVKYMVSISGAKEAIWPRRLLAEIKIMDSNELTKLMCNNESANKFSNNLMFHDWTKHIVIKHREKIAKKEIEVVHVASLSQSINILTKHLG